MTTIVSSRFALFGAAAISMHKHVNCFSNTAHGYFLFL